MQVIKNRVLERLSSFSDPQLMSLGWSFAQAGALDKRFAHQLREEAARRGAILDAQCSTTINLTSKIPNIPVIVENESHLVINKPRGIVVSLDSDLAGAHTQSHSSGKSQELQLLIKRHSNTAISQKAEFAHGILHRLDRDTSGALLIAKTFEAFYDLRMQFACGQVEKEYLALASGHLDHLGEWRSIRNRIATEKARNDSGLTIDSKLSLDGKSAYTQVLPVAHLRDPAGLNLSVVRIKIHTGRSHQIRVHMSAIGHPLLGDFKYGRTKTGTLMLHAYTLKFSTPATTIMASVKAPVPEDMVRKVDLSELLDGRCSF